MDIIIKKLVDYPDMNPDYIIGNNGVALDKKIYQTINEKDRDTLFSVVCQNNYAIKRIKLSIYNSVLSQWQTVKFEDLSDICQGISSDNEDILCQLSIQFLNETSARKFVNEMKGNIPSLSFLQNIQTVDIVPEGIDKKTAIERFATENNIHHAYIFTIGDGLNDRSMLAAYTSATFIDVCVDIKKSADYQVSSVSEWIRMIYNLTE